MTITPDPHQVKGAEVLLAALRKYSGALDASDPGVGKTVSFLLLCKNLNARPAIITRKPVIPAWKELAAAMGVEPLFVTNYESLLSESFLFTSKQRVRVNKSKTDPEAGTKNKAIFKGWNIDTPRVFFCWDEAQALRAPSTFASKAALDAAKRWKTVLLSATPFQSTMEARVIARILRMCGDHDEYRWMFNHGCRKDHFGRMAFVGDLPGETNAEKGRQAMLKLNAEIFNEGRGYRVRRAEIPGFPESQVSAEAVETGCSDEITKLYLEELNQKQLDDHARAAEGVDEEFKHLVEVMPMVVNLRIRQRIELLKAEAMAELARMAYEAGDRVAIFVNFDATIEVLRKKLKTDMVIRGGPMKNNFDRHNVASAFQANKEPFVLVNSAAGGAGISLHDPTGQVGRTAIISPPFSAVLLAQIEGRVWRRGGAFSRQRLVFAAGTVEERIMEVVRSRKNNLSALLDRDLDIRTYL